jgi:membrane-bound serine protease (ClpP class)
MTTITRYYLFQVPGWIFSAIILAFLCSWVGLPLWAALGLFTLLVIKDVVLYPFLRTAYEKGESGAAQLVGLEGVARDRLDPVGYIYVRGELWRARVKDGSEPIESGAAVKVVAGNRMTLTVVSG